MVSGEGFSDRWKGLEMVKSHSVLGEPVFLQYKVQEEKMREMSLKKLIRVRWSLHVRRRSWTRAHSPGVENVNAYKCQTDRVNEQNEIM